MPPVRPSVCRRNAFTLIELLVVIVIIAVLAAIALPLFGQMTIKSRQTTTLNNMRQLGMAFLLYAGENSNQLPGRTTGKDTDKWPKVLQPYVQNVLIYTAPVPTYAGTQYETKDPAKLTNNGRNETMFISNGYNDLGAFTDSSIYPRLNMITEPGKVILLGIQKPGKYNFYMDFYEGVGNNNDILDKSPWPAGSVYVFSDGSSRLLKYRKTDDMRAAPATSEFYSDWLWLIDKDKGTDIK